MECWGCKPLSLKEWKVIEQHFCSKLPLRVLQGFADTLPSNTVLNWQMYEQGNWMAQKAPSPLLSINYKTHPKMLTGSQWFETLLKKPIKWSICFLAKSPTPWGTHYPSKLPYQHTQYFARQKHSSSHSAGLNFRTARGRVLHFLHVLIVFVLKSCACFFSFWVSPALPRPFSNLT